MNILDQAMKIEKQGESLYLSFAGHASDKGAVNIFFWLAVQEKKHYDILQKMKENGPAPTGKSPDLKDVRAIFSGWKNTRARLDVKTDQVEFYRKALEVEDKSVSLYEEGAKKADNDTMKAVFLQIAAEEKTHRQVMENIIEFVTKPEIWTENAEFGNRGDDYYL